VIAIDSQARQHRRTGAFGLATRVGVVRRVICASPAYLARCGTPQRPEDLKDHDGITFRGFPIAPEWRYRKDSPALAVEPRTRLAVNSTEAAVDAALAGLGIIRVLSYQVADELPAACSPSWRSSGRSQCRSASSTRTQAYCR